MYDQNQASFIDYCRRRGYTDLLELPMADARSELVDYLREQQEFLTAEPVHYTQDGRRRERDRERAGARRRKDGAAPREAYLAYAAARATVARMLAAKGVRISRIAKLLGVSIRHAHRLASSL